ncbi:phosphotransferase enzyme family protein [Aspergillus ibericus CBS 121593]|uniref:Altered inheritance of mitochondria protein 9, mitochondrial n=1 Tax=Aspergillus ibericus CBS 121593 TaxID=1448316 RepID=A0A395GZ82_9EURO|nr:phosphotransferase enzyme family protein [Aspergillus ibericus CBS 121593]RAK99333.1 phosphotransferase enzyme family protein [Aspergillus ibericus CBS 121593]
MSSTIYFRSSQQVRPTSSRPSDTSSHYFNYTSGRWLINEARQLEKRHIKFDVSALQRISGQLIGSQCVRMNKIPEGLFNKVFSLQMENGKEILVRIPNPNAGHPHYIVASEVATLDFLRTVLEIPVPRVLSWSSSSQPNPVGAEYIVMERVEGRQLSEVWDDMSEAQRFGLVKSIVAIERKLVKAKFALHGSLYYRDTFPKGRRVAAVERADQEGQSRFVLGPTTQRSFWDDEKGALDIDRGPWETVEEYLSAVTNREIALIRNTRSRSSNDTVPFGKTLQRRDVHIQLLEQFLTVLPHILPPEEVLSPVLLHPDLHSNNIFVDSSDPSKISSIIDWQAVHTAPLFMQAKFPSIFNCDDIYPWGAVQPKLPEDFDTLSQVEKGQAEDKLSRLRLKKFYELASRKFNPGLIHAMDKMRNDNDPTTFIFDIVGRTSEDGPIPLKELLIQVFEKWDRIMERRGSTQPCPIWFSRKDIDESRQKAESWAAAFGDFERLRAEVIGEDGWVSHEDYKEALSRWEKNKTTLESLREGLESLM